MSRCPLCTDGHVSLNVSLRSCHHSSDACSCAGTYTVSVDYNQLPIFGSPYTTVVVPGRAAAASSVVGCAEQTPRGGSHATWPADSPQAAACTALTGGVAGEINQFTIVSRDAPGNDCTSGGEKVEALLMLPAHSWSESPLMGELRSKTRGAGVHVRITPPPLLATPAHCTHARSCRRHATAVHRRSSPPPCAIAATRP